MVRADVSPRGVTCFKCQNTGHIAKDCPYTTDADGKPLPILICFKCNGEGHLAKNCNRREDTVDSPNGEPSVSSVTHAAVYKAMLKTGMTESAANSIAHAAAGAANQCSIDLLSSRSKTKERGKPERTDNCFKCGRPGHIGKDCREREDLCYNCGKGGHKLRDCPKGNRGRSRTPPRSTLCFRCGGHGHLGRNCPHDEDVCFACGKEGHRSTSCPTRRR